MANTYKDIVITPNKSSATDDPKIVFSGANASVNTDITLRVYPESNGTLSFEGTAGQLFSITNDLSGSIFSVNDISGIPSIDVQANGYVSIAPFGGNVSIEGSLIFADTVGNQVGIGTTSPGYKLDVYQNVAASVAYTRVYNPNATGGAALRVEAQTGTPYIGILGAADSGGSIRVGAYSNHPLYFIVNNSTQGAIDTSGNFGIGNTSPTAKLVVNATATTAASLTWNATAGQILRNEASELAIGLHNANPYPLYMQGRTSASAARNIAIQPLGGSVGIGRYDPGYALDVVGTVNASSLLINGVTALIPSNVHYIGTTSIALNRTSASQSLTGVSIDGSAGSATTSTTQALTDNSTNIATTAWYNKAIYSTRGGLNLSGGGTVSYSGGYVKWTSRFIIISDSKGTSTPAGADYYDINCPTSGSIDVVGTTAVTATASGIPLGAWQALYYDLGDGSGGTASSFHIVSYSASTGNYMIPADWVLIAVQNQDNTYVKFTNGIQLQSGNSYDTNTYDTYSTPYSATSGSVTNSLTFNNSGSGDASGTTYNGGAARTLSYNSIGAAPTASPTFTGTVTFNANILSQTLTDAATIAWNVSLGQVATVTLAGNRIMGVPTNLKVGTYILHVIQDGVGGRTLDWSTTAGTVIKWPGGVDPVLTTTASARDVFSFISDGTNMYGSFLPDVK